MTKREKRTRILRNTPKKQREALVAEFKRGNLSGAEFARMISVKYPTFMAWVRHSGITTMPSTNPPYLPKQSAYVGRAASIALHRDDVPRPAMMIRDDLKAPFLALFRLECGFIITSEKGEYELVPVTEEEGKRPS